MSGTFHLPPLQGAVLLKALRAAAGDLEPEHEHGQEQEHGHGQEQEHGHGQEQERRAGAGAGAGAGARQRGAGRFRGDARCHIQYWSHGGRTSLDNLVSLCKRHHLLVHERGYLIAGARDGTFSFYRPDGTAIPTCPALPPAEGTIGDCHDADITPGTIIPPWYGERLDLDHAIYICFANAANRARQQAGNGPPPAQEVQSGQPEQPAQPEQPGEPEPVRPWKWAIEPQDWMPSLRRRA